MNEAERAGDLIETVVLVCAGAVACAAALFLAASRLAASLFGNGPLQAGILDAVAALTRLPHHLGDPAAAWPAPLAATLPGPVAYWCSLLIPAALLGGAGVGVARLTVRRQRGARPLGVDPDAGIARRLPGLEVTAPVPGRLTLGRVGRGLVAAETGASLAVVGPSGCGKTAGFAIPALLEWQGPVIATSVKTDLLEATLSARQRVGTVWVYDPTGCTGIPAAKWSPLPACTTWAGAQRVTAWLCDVSEPTPSSVNDAHYWTSQARLGLAPLLYAAATSGATMADVVRWVDTQEIEQVRTALARVGGLDELVAAAANSEDGRRLAAYYEGQVRAQAVAELRRDIVGQGGQQSRRATRPPEQWPVEWRQRLEDKLTEDLDALVRSELELLALRAAGRPLDPLVAAESLWAKEERLRSSVYATMQNILLGYRDADVAAAASACDIDLDAWLSGPNTIYLIAPHHDQQRLRPVLAVLLASAIRAAYDAANRAGGQLPRHCLALLDEAGNVAPAKDLPAWAATARSHGITLVSVWQDLAQIRSVYGDLASVVLNNHKAKIFGSGISDPRTLEVVSSLVGDQPVKPRNAQKSPRGQDSWSEQTTWRRVAPADAVRRLSADEALLVYGNEAPARLRLRPWWREARAA